MSDGHKPRPLHDRIFAVEPMSQRTSSIFIQLCLNEQSSSPRTAADLEASIPKELASLFQVQVMLRRLVMASALIPGLLFTEEAVIFAICLCENVGQIVCWSFELVHLARQSPCGMTALAYAFPDGFPTREAMTSYWERQKTPSGDNALDQPESWT